MLRLLSLIFILFLSYFGCSAQNNKNIDPCKLYGSVFVEKDRINATFRVYIDTTSSFANVNVFKQNNKLYADKVGQWYFTTVRDFADFSIYLEANKALADFVISYTNSETFAGCND